MIGQENEQIIAGSIIDSVHCQSDHNQSYALFLPTHYDDRLDWPVIYFFEPAARGTLPLIHFMEAAENYGYILVASNNARNGSWKLVFDAAHAMFQDVGKRFSLDSARIYTSGFSGGARAALAIAEKYDHISGVLACGAGLPNPLEYQPTPKSSYSYLGIVGDKDMNFMELHKVKGLLDSMQIRNRLLTFEGGHQWPPPETANEAIEWLELRSINHGAKLPNSIRSYFDKRIEEARGLKKEGALYLASKSYDQLIQDFEGLQNIGIAKEELMLLVKDKAFKKDAKQHEKLFLKEDMLIERYLQAFKGISIGDIQDTIHFRNTEWWNNESRYLQRLSSSKIKANQLIGKRMIDLIWRRCVETGNSYYAKGDYVRAIMIDEAWVQIHPNKRYPHYRLARSYARVGSVETALQQLQQAIEYGLKDFDLLKGEVAFQSLHDHEVFRNLLNKLR
ncbi:MAG: TPR end-of-group domain-containing protein [Cyclobacteriaceae bacterium]